MIELEEEPATQYQCPRCKTGILTPLVSEEHETEISEHYVCNQCKHHANIPAKQIIACQLLSSLFGGIITAYLFLEEMQTLVTYIQFDISTSLTKVVALLLVSLLFLLGFAYILYVGLQGIKKRNRYLARSVKFSHPATPTESNQATD